MAALDPEWTGALPHTLVLGADGTVLFRQTGDSIFSRCAVRLFPPSTSSLRGADSARSSEAAGPDDFWGHDALVAFL